MNVSVAVVAYNEEKSLPKLLKNICDQDYPHEKIEVLLIDSMSKDKTKEIMHEFKNQEHGFYRVAVLDNPEKLIPCGHNVAIDNYTGDALVRVDAHVMLPQNFLSLEVAGLMQGENVYGGVVESTVHSDNNFSQTMLIAENSSFCGGVASFRRNTQKAYVDTLAFALYRREVFDKVGKYNPLLPRSEDNDMNCRVREAGYKLCCDPAIKSIRFSRSTFWGLIKQKYLNGYWVGKTTPINSKCYSLYHFVPFLFVLAILFTSVLTAFALPHLSILMWAAYAFANFFFSIKEIISNRFWITNLLLPLLFLILHISYGIGTLLGFAAFPFWKKVKKCDKTEKVKDVIS